MDPDLRQDGEGGGGLTKEGGGIAKGRVRIDGGRVRDDAGRAMPEGIRPSHLLRNADRAIPCGLGGAVPLETIGGRAEFVTYSLNGNATGNPLSWLGMFRGGRLGTSLRRDEREAAAPRDQSR